MLGFPDEEQLSELSLTSQIFIILCYGFILFKAATYIGEGSEKLLLLYGPGLIGGLIIPVLGAIPDGAIVLVSGLGDCAQDQINIGVGTLAGSTIMLLTIPWAISVFLGYRDLDTETGKAASYPNGKPKCENGFTLGNSVVTTYSNIPWSAKIMMITAFSYLIVTIPAIIYKGTSEAKKYEHWPAFTGIIVCALAFVAYSLYQIIDSRAQTDQEMKQQKLKFIKWRNMVGSKFGHTDSAIRTVFDRFDKDGNGTIDRNELYNGFLAMGLQCSRQQVFKIMEDMNVDEDRDNLTFEEFKVAVKKWSRSLLSSYNMKSQVNVVENQEDDDTEMEQQKHVQSPLLAQTKPPSYQSSQTQPPSTNTATSKVAPKNETEEKKAQSHENEDSNTLIAKMWNEEFIEDAEDEEQHLELSDSQLLMAALGYLFLGTFLVTIFSDPMVDAISAFSDTVGIDAFFVSFVITPIASNASEIYSALLFARKKTSEGITLGMSSLYGAACMNNTFVLCIFCTLIFVRNLQWTFLVETLVILLTIFVVGIIGLRETIYVWHAIIVIMLFPLSLLLVATLDSVLDDTTDETC